MRRGTIIWIGVLALCISGTVYEMPNAVLNLRYHRNLFMDVEDHVERIISNELIAGDPEAGEILRYAIKRDADRAGREDLKVLVEEYPQNEFFLAELAEDLAESKNIDLQEMLAVSDKLLALDPNNAHYRYLRGWVLLDASGGKERIAEALEQFELGDRLPKLSVPYHKYKPRVDRIAEQAVLDKFDRPWIQTFYPDLGGLIAGSLDWRSPDEEQLHRLIAAGSTIADRVIQNAYDTYSLHDGGRMMEKIEELRLQKPGRSKSEDSHARARLDLARAIDDLRWGWDDDLWLTHPSMGKMMPVFIPIWLLVVLFRARSASAWPPNATKSMASFSAWYAVAMLIALAVFVMLYGRRSFPGRTLLLELPWALLWFFWIGYAEVFADIGSAGGASSPSVRSRAGIAHGLFCLIGTALLLIGNSSFLWSANLAGWSRSLPLLAVWLVFGGLLWLSMYDRQPVFDRVPYRVAVIVAISWAGLLMSFDMFGTHWHYESRAYAEPLTFCTPLPAVAQEAGG